MYDVGTVVVVTTAFLGLMGLLTWVARWPVFRDDDGEEGSG